MTQSDISVKMIETDDDCFMLANLAALNIKESAPHLPFDHQFTFSRAYELAHNKEKTGYHAWLALDSGVPIGYFVGSINPYLFSPALRGDQHIWYVAPDHRRSNAARLLFSAFEDFAVEAGVIEIYAGAEMEDVEKADRLAILFPRMGFKRNGSTFNKLIGE